MKLASIPHQPPLVIAAGKLEKRGIQSHNADASFAACDGRREIAGQSSDLYIMRPMRGLFPPLAVGCEGVIDHAAIRACWLVPEFLFDALKAVFLKESLSGGI